MIAYHDTEWGVPVHDDPHPLRVPGARGRAGRAELAHHPQAPRRLPPGLRRLRRRQGGPLHAGPGGEAAGRPRHHPQPGQGRGRRCATPAPSWPSRRSSAPSTPTCGASWAGGPIVNKWRRIGADPRRHPDLRGAQRRPAPARLRLRRPDRLLRPPAGHRAWSTTTWSSCFRYAELTGRRRIRTRAPKRRHDRLLGRQAVRGHTSRRPGRPRRSPPRRRRARSRARRGRWPA